MKIRILCFLICFSFATFVVNSVYAQTTVWSENFTANPCDSLCTANGYTDSNGTWTLTTGVEETYANQWFISKAEAAPSGAGACGGSGSSGGNTLHVANVPGSPNAANLCPTGDCGAIYDVGKSTNMVVTDKRVETPVINLSGDTNLVISFLYFEGGDGTNDKFTLDYFDGTSWSPLDSPATTLGICPSGGYWTAYSKALPPSANKNPNVKIGFHWVNNDDGIGSGGFSITQSSVAISDIAINTAPSLPVAAFTGGDTSFCTGGCQTYTNTSTGGTSWRWTFTGGSIGASPLQNPPTVCYSTAGTYTTRLIAINSAGSDTLIKTFIVNNCTPTTITTGAVGSTSCVCATFSLSYTITGTFNSGNIFTAQLSDASGSFTSPVSIGTVNSVASGNISVTIPCNSTAAAGYKIRIISSNPAITGSEASTAIVEVPTSTFTVNPNSVCSDEPVTVTYTGTASVGATYNWNFNGGTANPGGAVQGPQTVTWATAGTKTITLTVVDGDCTSTAGSQQVTVNAIPTANFVAESPVCAGGYPSTLTYTGSGSTGATYTWNFAGGTGGIAGEGPQNISWTTAGTYKVTLSVTAEGCVSATDTQQVVVNNCTGVNNISPASSLQFYPNPAGDKLSVISYLLSGGTLQIMDVLGKTVLIKKTTENKTTIDVSNLNPGVYFLSVKYADGNSEVRKFVKE